MLRVFSYAFGIIGSVTAFTHLAMAGAFALIFLRTVFVTVMSAFFLKEQVGIKQWSAVVITFLAAGPGEKKISLFGAGILGGIVICGLVTLPSFEPPTLAEWGLLADYSLLTAFANVPLSIPPFTRRPPISDRRYTVRCSGRSGSVTCSSVMAWTRRCFSASPLSSARHAHAGARMQAWNDAAAARAVSNHQAALALTPDKPPPHQDGGPEQANS